VHGVRSHQRSTLSHLSIFRPKKESTEHPLAARREREVPMRPGSATRLVSHRPPGLRARRDRSAPGRVAPYGPTSTALLAPVACARAPVYRQRRRRTTPHVLDGSSGSPRQLPALSVQAGAAGSLAG
jgi:hypothetical protein